MNKNKMKLIVAMVIQLLALVNLVLAAMGKSPLAVSGETIELVVGGMVACGVTAYNFYKNRNFTDAAKAGQQVINLIKAGQLLPSEVDVFLSNMTEEDTNE